MAKRRCRRLVAVDSFSNAVVGVGVGAGAGEGEGEIGVREIEQLV